MTAAAMPILFWDVETRSALDLRIAGAWRYASDPSTEVLCLGFAVDDGEPQIWIPGKPDPEAFVAAASDSTGAQSRTIMNSNAPSRHAYWSPATDCREFHSRDSAAP